MCRVDDADGGVWLTEPHEVKARKDHRCVECCRTIAKGETYEYAVALHDDYFSSFHTCPQCKAAAWWLVRECRGYIGGEVIEEMAEHREEGYEGLTWLIAAARRGWRRRCQLIPVATVQAWVDQSLALIPAEVRAHA